MSAEKVVVDADLWEALVEFASLSGFAPNVSSYADAVPVERWAPDATVWREVAR